MTPRRVIWIGVVAAAVASIAFAPDESGVVQPALAPAVADTSSAQPMVLAIRPRETSGRAANPFPARPAPPRPSTVMRAPSPLPQAEPAPPAPPPIPFQVVGRFVDDGREAVFVMHGEQTLVARTGDTLAGSYRVEGVAPGALTLTYLPLQLRQTLPIPQTP